MADLFSFIFFLAPGAGAWEVDRRWNTSAGFLVAAGGMMAWGAAPWLNGVGS